MFLAALCLMAKDVKGLAQFYCKVLKTTAEGDEVHQEVATNGAALAILQDNEAVARQGGNFSFAFDVEDVITLYISRGRPGEPLSKLVAFERVKLPAGSRIDVDISLAREALMMTDDEGRAYFPTGAYRLGMGSPREGSQDAWVDIVF